MSPSTITYYTIRLCNHLLFATQSLIPHSLAHLSPHSTGSLISSCYARAIKQSALSFDVIFGPAYKGIPLVTCVSVAWHQLFGEDKDICYNRKEAKDHGEVWELLRCLLFIHATVYDDTVSKLTYSSDWWMDGF